MQLFWIIYLFLIISTYFERCIRPSSGAGSYIGGQYQKLEIQSSAPDDGLAEAVNTVECP